MNFLAHFHLAWPDEGLVSGGLEGEYHRGRVAAHLPSSFAQGIQLHRSIDAYTDHHPIVADLRRQFPPALRRFAGILIDLSFDHYLTLHWHRYGELDLKEFNARVMIYLDNSQHHLSAPAVGMLQRMRDHDILNLYHDWKTVTASAQRIGERFKRGNPFHTTERDLEPLRPQMEAAFLSFYPDLKQFSQLTIDRLARTDVGAL